MKKTYRIKKESEFQAAFKKGKSFANRQLVLYVYPKPEQVHFRVGLSVGKKNGNAVKRNQIKRYLRQGVYELSSAIRPDVDILLIARQDIRDKTFHQVKQSLIHVMKLANILDTTQLNSLIGGQHETN
ncbi:ribonuclease P protein component [Aerococcaceae bacterium NML191292]|nr:ribonuclease P protein component [Aerococcaceae bacterium NML210727]MCW6654911.1 ribonuclease P protein component [Aerococcaceae bacterium NML201296]MCW6660121.1 ribonuclease P protein component [Aerococcaceae bacterium NML191292]MCW6662235.1 ribonuclease P protein component [Aerococcaceae bacterium NML201209]MCW6662692.1 ribonuclease P protein component [Aerococcaceae bacterium NML190073]MCW6665858.1 ribonuclease P protein component [Aerococcaceae bacterium NML191219]MCW6666168.1 ribonucl